MRRSGNVFKLLGGLTVIGFCLTFFQNCSNFESGGTATPDGNFLRLSGLDSQNQRVQEEVPYKVVEGNVVIQGDIIVGQEEMLFEGKDFSVDKGKKLHAGSDLNEAQTSGVYVKDRKWPQGDDYYVIHSSMTQQVRIDRVREARDRLNALFRENDIGINIYEMDIDQVNEQDFVMIKPSAQGCNATLGYWGGVHSMNIPNWCRTGSVMHEFLHNLGALHEHNRFDRDTFVTINLDKIVEEQRHNFAKSQIMANDVGDYDFGSLMHYHLRGFSIDGSDTITVNEDYTEFASLIGNRENLSAGDIASLKEVYPEDNETFPPGTSPRAQVPALNLDIPVPGEPEINIASTTSNSFEVTWDLLPAEQQIEDYRVFLYADDEYVTDSGRLFRPDAELKRTFEDLDPEKSYDVLVVAHSPIGWGRTRMEVPLAEAPVRGPASRTTINACAEEDSCVQGKYRISGAHLSGQPDVPFTIYVLSTNGHYCAYNQEESAEKTFPYSILKDQVQEGIMTYKGRCP